ncbi:MAG: ABC transporter ATP-binding protein [Candidatus Buchananbacteria bacterium RIFCSPHIGHO2_02_FULL_56_16]|uniref:ABC transporter ATP-binding protein n=1 Tax=Candidatus Buchananbacteria bacterium RIFCSPHIGHO2_02_FULL_56_16 TaxID=1797542 RepID=A0A1G1YI61_9BACT|nr:MAG: ABC transporter ATP-binding protein [Candidatus Buchananbacteria bacterium RIFCSPHIGHO2_02_FULL_56_16]
MPKYGYAKQLNIPFDTAINKTIAALKKEGFGVLTDIDVRKTLKEKLNVEFKRYRILGVCNPTRAYQALQNEEEIGLLLPCNVIVYEKDGSVVVSALKPSVAFTIIDNEKLKPLADAVEVILQRVIDRL